MPINPGSLIKITDQTEHVTVSGLSSGNVYALYCCIPNGDSPIDYRAFKVADVPAAGLIYFELSSEIFAQYMPNTTEITGWFELEINNHKMIDRSSSITIRLNDSIAPTITSVQVSDANTKAAGIGEWVQNQSKAHVVTTAVAPIGGKISKISVSVDGKTYTGADITSDAIKGTGAKVATVTVKDSRGRTATRNVSIGTVLAYTPPKITAFTPYRCNNDASFTPNDEGTHVGANAEWSIKSLNSHNAHTYKLQYKKTSASSYSTFKAAATASYSFTGVLGNNSVTFNADDVYNVKLTITDTFGSASVEALVTTTFTLINFRNTGHGISFGKASEDDIFECALEAKFKKSVTFEDTLWLYPVGSIYISVNSTNPSQFFGGTWVQIKDRFLLAAGDTYYGGQTGGEATHQLTSDEMPRHSHKFTGTGGDIDGYSQNYLSLNGTTYKDRPAVALGQGYTSNGYVALEQSGASEAHNNMPPYLAVYIWKRTA